MAKSKKKKIPVDPDIVALDSAAKKIMDRMMKGEKIRTNGLLLGATIHCLESIYDQCGPVEYECEPSKDGKHE